MSSRSSSLSSGSLSCCSPSTDVEMAGRAGAAAPARVFEGDAGVHRDVEKRFGQAVLAERQLAVLELDGLLGAVAEDEVDFRHDGILMFTLLTSCFSVRVHVRFEVRCSVVQCSVFALGIRHPPRFSLPHVAASPATRT